ncbi:MAG: PilT/PilU family type 4a pilus ATPase [Planctomycetota bacterium]|nr:MAG: PilT/PilU family type 4a pilus ATPase [Planctomycetota bacterium]
MYTESGLETAREHPGPLEALDLPLRPQARAVQASIMGRVTPRSPPPDGPTTMSANFKFSDDEFSFKDVGKQSPDPKAGPKLPPAPPRGPLGTPPGAGPKSPGAGSRPGGEGAARKPEPPPATGSGAAGPQIKQTTPGPKSGAPAPKGTGGPKRVDGPKDPSRPAGQGSSSASGARKGSSNKGSSKPEPRASGSKPAGPDARKAGEASKKKPGTKRRRLERHITHVSTSSPRHQVEAWLAVMVKSGASDLILRAGGRPSQRISGKISFLPGRVPGPGPLLEVLEGVIGEKRMEAWHKSGSADAAISLDGLGRFRLNAYKQMGEPAVVIRRIAEHAPNLDELDLPSESLKKLALKKRGFVVVTGVAGSGKSTTLAAMIQYVNKSVERHIITLEDPVELLFKEDRCVISQREVGTDTKSFKDGLKHALRQSPDLMLIGEVRDAETVVAALEATETGHMVMSTMHTVNAAQTVDRILGFFPVERHKQLRQRLADNLVGVLSQRLVPRRGEPGLVPAFELMISTPHIRELIEEGKTSELARVIESGTEPGLVSFNECLRGLVEGHMIELNDALATSDRPDELLLALRGIRGSKERVKGPKPSQVKAEPGPDGLRMAGGE